MADKSFGLKQVNLINASGTPRIESPNNLNINAVNVAISTDITVGGMVSLGTGTSISSPATNVLTLGTNSVERLRITSNGNIGAGGITTPTFTTGGGIHLGDAYGIGFGNGDNGRPDFQIVYDTGQNNGLQIRCGNGADTADVYFTTAGNLAFASGKGIDFSASATDGTTVDSEILSDYEEGEWTPTIGGSTSDPTFTLGNNRCRYIKIGRLVIAQMDFDGTISGAGNGQLEASLPFAVANPSPKPYCDIFGARNCSMIAAETYKVTGWTVEGTSRARFSLSTGTNGAETIVSWGVNVNTSGTPRLCAAFAYYSTT